MARLTVELRDVRQVADLARFLELLDLLGLEDGHPIAIHAGSAHLSATTGLSAIDLPGDEPGTTKET